MLFLLFPFISLMVFFIYFFTFHWGPVQHSVALLCIFDVSQWQWRNLNSNWGILFVVLLLLLCHTLTLDLYVGTSGVKKNWDTVSKVGPVHSEWQIKEKKGISVSAKWLQVHCCHGWWLSVSCRAAVVFLLCCDGRVSLSDKGGVVTKLLDWLLSRTNTQTFQSICSPL